MQVDVVFYVVELMSKTGMEMIFYLKPTTSKAFNMHCTV